MKRLNYIDGLKGWCAVSIWLLHFQLMFAQNGFVGWSCLPEAAMDPVGYYFKWFPYSILTNNSFPLYIFFALISFLVCYLFLKNKNEDKLKQKIVMRYFRFLPLVLIASLAAYLFLAFELYPLKEFYEITGNTWGYALIENSFTLFDALKIGFFTSFFERTHLVSPFWCMHYIFLGSILTYLATLLYTRVNGRFFFAFLVVVFFFADQTYLSFIIGMIVAVIADKEYTLSKVSGGLLVFAGCLFGLFPPVLLPGLIDISTLYAIGAGFIIVGIHFCFSGNRLLCNRFMEFLGQESLSSIVWQMFVLQSLSVFLFNSFYHSGMNALLNIAINFVVNITVTLFLTWASSKTITPLTNYVCARVQTLLWKHAK